MAFVNLLVINLFAFVLLDAVQLKFVVLFADVFYVVSKVLLICRGKYTHSPFLRFKSYSVVTS